MIIWPLDSWQPSAWCESSVDNVGHGNWELAGCRDHQGFTDQDRCLGVTLSVRDVTLLVMMMMMMMMMMTSLFLLQRAGWAAPQVWCLDILWILSRWHMYWPIRDQYSTYRSNCNQRSAHSYNWQIQRIFFVTIYQLQSSSKTIDYKRSLFYLLANQRPLFFKLLTNDSNSF